MNCLDNENEEELDSRDEIRIGDLKQWRLLLAVCRIFGHDHPWTTLNPDTEQKVIKKQSKLFTTYILEIPVHVPTNLVLIGNEREDFELRMNALLSSLECLVNGNKLPADAIEAEPATASDISIAPDLDLGRRCPKLLGLSSLPQDAPPEDYGQYLYLCQNAKSFKRTCREVEEFLKYIGMLRIDREAASTQRAPETVSRPSEAEPKATQPKSRFSHAFWSQSKSLFESLVTSFQSCDQIQAERKARYSSHRAMLHLKTAQDQDEGENCPKVCIALAACVDRETWHQIHCTLSPSMYVQ